MVEAVSLAVGKVTAVCECSDTVVNLWFSCSGKSAILRKEFPNLQRYPIHWHGARSRVIRGFAVVGQMSRPDST